MPTLSSYFKRLLYKKGSTKMVVLFITNDLGINLIAYFPLNTFLVTQNKQDRFYHYKVVNFFEFSVPKQFYYKEPSREIKCLENWTTLSFIVMNNFRAYSVPIKKASGEIVKNTTLNIAFFYITNTFRVYHTNLF